MTLQNKRFIAGATCPKCKAMDTIMSYVEDDIEKLECVECGYKKSQADEAEVATVSESDSVIGIFKPE